MTNRLTKKEQGFIKDFIATDNGVQSALNNYDTKNYSTAGAIAHENLKKPKIIEAILEALPDEELDKKHKQLLNATNLRRIEFDEYDEDEVIERVISEMEGYTLLHIVRRLNKEGEVLACYAYVKEPDSLIQDKALDKAYKIKGKYAPERHVTLNIDAAPSPEVQEAAHVLNEYFRHKGSSNGTIADPMDTETPDQN